MILLNKTSLRYLTRQSNEKEIKEKRNYNPEEKLSAVCSTVHLLPGA